MIDKPHEKLMEMAIPVFLAAIRTLDRLGASGSIKRSGDKPAGWLHIREVYTTEQIRTGSPADEDEGDG